MIIKLKIIYVLSKTEKKIHFKKKYYTDNFFFLVELHSNKNQNVNDFNFGHID